MVREEGLSGSAFLATLSLAAIAARVVVLFAMATSEPAAQRVADRLHLAGAADLAEAREDSARAAARADVAVSYAEVELARLEEQLGVLTQQAGEGAVEAAELRDRLEGLTDVAAIDDLVFQVSELQRRLTALEERLAATR